MRYVDPMTLAPLVGRVRPARHGALRVDGRGERTFPVFGGVPVLVPSPTAWCARHHDAILAALAVAGLLDDDALALVRRFADADDEGVEAAPFVDDFTPAEARDEPPPEIAHGALGDLVEAALVAGPTAWIAARTPRAKSILEVGPGAGGLTALLAARATTVWTLDLSLRSVLLAMAKGGANVRGVIGDACALPFGAGSFDVVVAENVIDVIEDPRGFLAGCARALRPGGRLLLTTPGPALRGRDARALDTALRVHGFVVDDAVDGILWPRVHGSRHVELWVCRGLAATKRVGPASRGRRRRRP